MVAVGCGGLSNEDWNDTAVRVVVISPTGEVWCGVGWHATPTVHIYRAATPGWASLDGVTPVTVPLADIESALT